jgi:two-component system, cell cycle response regulator
MKQIFQTINTAIRIVIAEDDKTSRVMLNAILRKWGYDVVAAKDGMECLEMICTSPIPTIGLLDWHLPDFDGTTICQSLRKIQTDQPIHLVLMTTVNDGTEALRSLENGADDFLAKPYSIYDLNAQMLKAERHLNLQQQLRFLEWPEPRAPLPGIE